VRRLRQRGQGAAHQRRRHTFYTNLRESPVIQDGDSEERRTEKLRRIEENFLRLEKVKAEKAEEVVYLLDLFEGKITVNELINMEMPYLNQLRNAKMKINNDIIKNKKR
jgi:hypothetical protein